MQLIVLGMHRSGTSAVTRLLNMMGAYVGDEQALKGANVENLKGFWEREDLVDVNKKVLETLGLNWWRLSNFKSEDLQKDNIRRIQGEFKEVLLRLEPHRPWAIKDPRMCLLMPLWRELFEVPVGVFVTRNPLQIAQSLETRDGFPIPVGLALWERYTIEAIAASKTLPSVFVNYEELVKKPVQTTGQMFKDLQEHGVRGLTCPPGTEIRAFIDEKLLREKASSEEAEAYMTQQQKMLYKALLDGTAGSLDPEPSLSPAALSELRLFESAQQFEAQEKEKTDQNLELQRQVREFDQRLGKRDKELDRIRALLDAKTAACDEAESARRQSEGELAILRTKVASYETELFKLESARRQSEGELTILRTKVANYETELFELKSARRQSEGELAGTRSEAAEWRQRFDREKLEAERAHREVEQQRKEVDAKRAELQTANSDIVHLSRWVDNLRSLCNQVESKVWWKLAVQLRQTFDRLRMKPRRLPYALTEARKLFELHGNWQKARTEKKKPPRRIDTANLLQGKDRETEQLKEPLKNRQSSAALVGPGPDLKPNIGRQTLQVSAYSKQAAGLFHELKHTPTIDVVVCIHNALDDVKVCLASLMQNTRGTFRIIAVNDGSDKETSLFVQGFASCDERVVLIENDTPQGYTKAANQGLRASTADYVVLLNSDTIVPLDWTRPLFECGEAAPNVGIVGPLSNAASFQSVPDRRTPEGDWAVNTLPEKATVADMARLVRRLSDRKYPRVPFVNGFCYVIKRSVVAAVGYFDEEAFPHGYGEENDYSLRAQDAGFELAIADHGYVYHQKSRSFGNERRLQLSQAGTKAFRDKHGTDRLTEGVKVMEEEPVLREMAQRVSEWLADNDLSTLEQDTAEAAPARRPDAVDETDEVEWVERGDIASGPISPEDYAMWIEAVEDKRPTPDAPAVSARIVVLAIEQEDAQHLENTLKSVKRAGADLAVDLLAAPGTARDDVAFRYGAALHKANRDTMAAVLNDVFSKAGEEYILLLPVGDVLDERATAWLAEVLDCPAPLRERTAAVVVDDDEMEATGRRVAPRLKPGFSPDWLLEYDYVGHGVWLNRQAVLGIGGFDANYRYEGLRDVLLRLSDAGCVIGKSDRVACHRLVRECVPVCQAERRRLLEDSALRRDVSLAAVEQLPHGPRPKYHTHDMLASIVIPFKDKVDFLKQCVDSILAKTAYPHYEVLLVNNQSQELETLAYLKTVASDPRVRVLDYDRPFNYSRVNNYAVGYARGKVLVFLNNDTQIITASWLEELVGDALQPGVGAVGAKLYYGDGRLQHAGVVVGLNGLAGHLMAGMNEPDAPRELTQYRRNVSAVTAACLGIRKEVFEEAGRFSEQFLVTGNDVEFCLRLRDLGYRNVFNPEVRVFHFEKGTRKHIQVKDIDIELSLLHYQPYLDEGDPYYNTQLSLNVNHMALNMGEPAVHENFRAKYQREKEAREAGRKQVEWKPGKAVPSNGNMDDEVVVYDVTPDILRANEELMVRFFRYPYLELNRAIWFMPFVEHIFRGGIYTIFRAANHFSERAGTHNTFVFSGHRHTSKEQTHLEIQNEFPNMQFDIIEYSQHQDINGLPEADAAFATLWTTAYHVVRYNKCKAKFSFMQDYEPCFYAAGSVYGLIEETYRFGFAGIANTPGVAAKYREFTPWVDYFVPAVDTTIYTPGEDNANGDRPFRIAFYGRPNNPRNAFRLGIEVLRQVKEIYGDRVEIISAGSEFSLDDYGLKGVLENYGILPNLEAVADLYRSSGLGLVFMFSAHPSYQPFEFMASGCVTVTNDNPHNRWFLRDGDNAVLAGPTVGCVTGKIVDVIENAELRQRVVEGGLATVRNLSWPNALDRIYSFVTHPKPCRGDIPAWNLDHEGS